MTEIHQAFLNTTYRILNNPDINIKINNIIPELNHLNSWAYLTAWNPFPEILTLNENQKRNEQLKEDIQIMGLNFIPGIGISEDLQWSEESFFIENISLDNSKKLATKYGQLAFVFANKNETAALIYSKK